MVQRQALGRLHHTEHDLSGDQPFFGHAELAQIAVLLAQPFGADGGHIVEDARQVLIDQGPQQAADDFVDASLLGDERVHGAQEMLMLDGLNVQAGQAHRLQPAQHAQFGVGVAQAVEDHRPQQRLDIDGVTGTPKHGAKTLKAQGIPQLAECPDVAVVTRRLKLDQQAARQKE